MAFIRRMARERQDLTRVPDLAAAASTAGPRREEHPVHVDLLPPCNVACPAGENIQAWLAHVEAGRFEDAWRTIVAEELLGLEPARPGWMARNH